MLALFCSNVAIVIQQIFFLTHVLKKLLLVHKPSKCAREAFKFRVHFMNNDRRWQYVNKKSYSADRLSVTAKHEVFTM